MTEISLKMLFDAFEKLNNHSEQQKILEVSIQHNQITLLFDSNNIIYMDTLSEIEEIIAPVEITDITVFENGLRASCRDLTALKPTGKVINKNPFCLFKYVIDQIREIVCKCPALEFTITESYIKCYIDKPNMPLTDLVKLDDVFNEAGTLELGHQRSYVLYVRTG